MLPGLKIKLNKSELRAMQYVIMSACENYSLSGISKYAIQDFTSEFVLKIQQRLMRHSNSYSISMNPQQLLIFNMLAKNNNSVFGQYERNVLQKIYELQDRLLINLPPQLNKINGLS